MNARDYSDYSIAELREALRSVDGNKYPENKSALEAILQARKDSGEYQLEVEQVLWDNDRREAARRRFAKKARPWVGNYLIATSPLVAFGYAFWLPEEFAWALSPLIGVTVFYAVIAAIAGFGLIRKTTWGHYLAVAIFALQLIRIESASLYLSLSSAVAGFFTLSTNVDIGFEALFEPGLRLTLADVDGPIKIGINLLAFAFLWTLFKARETAPEDE